MLILVHGRAGRYRRAVSSQLLSLGHQVRFLVKRVGLAPEEANVVYGDWRDPATVQAAFEGVDAALLIPPIHENSTLVLERYIEEVPGNVHLVRLSVVGAAHDSDTAVLRQYGEGDALVRYCGLPYTIIQQNLTFQQLEWSSALRTSTTGGTLELGLGDAACSMVDSLDLADATVRVLVEPGHDEKTYRLTGPRALTGIDIATTIGYALGRDIVYRPVAASQIAHSRLSNGARKWDAQVVSQWMAWYAHGYAAQVSDDVRSVTGHEARTFEDFVRHRF